MQLISLRRKISLSKPSAEKTNARFLARRLQPITAMNVSQTLLRLCSSSRSQICVGMRPSSSQLISPTRSGAKRPPLLSIVIATR